MSRSRSRTSSVVVPPGFTPIVRVARRRESPPPSKSLAELTDAFVVSRKVSGVSRDTEVSYSHWLKRLAKEVDRPDSLTVQRFLSSLRERGLSASSVHKAFSVVRTFFRWCVATGAIKEDPLRAFSMKTPRTLPKVPSDKEVVAALEHAGTGVIGLRNRALILAMADAGLRASEIIRLRVEHADLAARSIVIRSGKGSKDRTTFFGLPTAHALRRYLAARQLVSQDDFVFVNDDGSPMNRRHLVQILHRISERADIPDNRRLHPHALRHFAATSWLRSGMGVEAVRRLLGHSSLDVTTRYSNLVSADLREEHRRAAAIERIGLRE